MSTATVTKRLDRLDRAGTPPLLGQEFRGVATAKPREDLGGRVLVEQRFALRAIDDEDGPVIEGLGAVYDTWATIGYFWPFREKFARGAFAKTIADGGDVRSMLNHNTDRLLARTKSGSLTLSEDDTGLHYRIAVNRDDPNAMSAWAQVQRGDIDGSSIWFEVVREEWTFVTVDNGLEMDEVIIREAKLTETGPVVFPAYVTTEASARAIDAVLESLGVDDLDRRREAVTAALSSPDRMEEILRESLGVADLRALRAVTGHTVPDAEGRAAEEAPDPELGDTPVRNHLSSWQIKQRGLAARIGS